MSARHYTLLIVDRSNGLTRSATISLRPFLSGVVFVLSMPILIGLGAQWSARTEAQHLQVTNTRLREENNNYRAAVATFATQIQSLEELVDGLGARAALDTVTAKARQKLPTFLKARAAGGPRNAVISTHGAGRPASSPEGIPSIWPVHGWLTGSFGVRTDPFTGERGFHQGIDISTDEGQPVLAMADATVESALFSGDYGNLVVLQHGFGLVTRYGHLSAFAVSAGAHVTRGDVVGYVGDTGRATGPHLHFEILVDGQLVNPLLFMTGSATP